MSNVNLGYLKCSKCGWVHFRVSRDYAEQEVEKFNEYFESLSIIDQESFYGGKKSSIDSYEQCFKCGCSNEYAQEVGEDQVPFGSTIQPMISPVDYPKISLKKKQE